MAQPESCGSIPIDEFPHQRGACLRLFQLHQVRRVRQEVVVHGQNMTEIERRQVPVRQGRIRSDDLDRTTKLRKVHQHGARGGILQDLRFVFSGIVEINGESAAVAQDEQRAFRISMTAQYDDRIIVHPNGVNGKRIGYLPRCF